MPTRVRHFWDRLKAGEPGRRFQDHYDATARDPRRRHPVWRVVKVILAIFAIAIGLVEVVFPGPAVLFFFVGGGLLATEFRWAAKFMDAAEVRGRRIWKRVRQLWRRLSPWARHTVVGLVACVGAAGALLMYRVVIR